MSGFDISYAGSLLVLLLIVVPIAAPFAVAGYLVDRIKARRGTPMLLRNGLLRGRAVTSHRYFHDVGDSVS